MKYLLTRWTKRNKKKLGPIYPIIFLIRPVRETLKGKPKWVSQTRLQADSKKNSG